MRKVLYEISFWEGERVRNEYRRWGDQAAAWLRKYQKREFRFQEWKISRSGCCLYVGPYMPRKQANCCLFLRQIRYVTVKL